MLFLRERQISSKIYINFNITIVIYAFFSYRQLTFQVWGLNCTYITELTIL